MEKTIKLKSWLESELGRRILTGVLGAALLIAWIFLGGRIGISVMATLLALGSMYEYAKMVFSLPDCKEKTLAMLGMTWLIAFINFWVPRGEYELLVFGGLSLFVYYLILAERYTGEDQKSHFKELALSIFGLVYLAFLPLYLPLIYAESKGPFLTFLFFLIVFCGDTGAFFVGRKWGRRKLYPEISPNKTVEGALGGLACSLLITLVSKLTYFPSLSWWAVFFMPPLVGAVAQAGDFCESFLKRSFAVKDSGSILPGHGGFLDRFDGVLFALPMMYMCVRILA